MDKRKMRIALSIKQKPKLKAKGGVEIKPNNNFRHKKDDKTHKNADGAHSQSTPGIKNERGQYAR